MKIENEVMIKNLTGFLRNNRTRLKRLEKEVKELRRDPKVINFHYLNNQIVRIDKETARYEKMLKEYEGKKGVYSFTS